MRVLWFLIACVATASLQETAGEESPARTARTMITGPRADEDFPIVDTDSYKGVIVPAEAAARTPYLEKRYEGFWTPEPVQIEKAEMRIKSFLEGVKTDWSANTLLQLPHFRRQYVGHTSGGVRLILCSFFPGVLHGDDALVHLRRSFLKVLLGGPSFWQIHYAIDANECTDLKIDGMF
jgi:hypothetical protein